MTTMRICFLGDSVTVGTGDQTAQGWPTRLAALEQARGHDISVYNLGIRAETCPQIAARWRQEAMPRLPDHVDGRLVFMFGINDCARAQDGFIRVDPSESVSQATQMIQAAAAWKPAIWIGMTPVRTPAPTIAPGPGVSFTFDRDRTAALNTAYREAASALGVPYIDLHAKLLDDVSWDAVLEEGDGVHPTAAGYARVADLITQEESWRTWFN